MLQPVFSDEQAVISLESKVEKVASVQQTAEKKPLKRMSDQLKSPSIKDALAGKMKEDRLSAKEQHEVYHRAGEVNDFTPEALKQKWNEFVTRLFDRPNLQSTLSRIPILKADYHLVLSIDNSVQEDLINTIKPELLSWLRSELKNSRIQLNTAITETAKEKVIYTDSEKYLEMLKKNPHLDVLKQKFKLDFE